MSVWDVIFTPIYNKIQQSEGKIMALLDDLKAEVAAVKASQDELKTKVETMISRVEAVIATLSTVPDVEVQQAIVDLQAAVDEAKTIGAEADAERP